MQNHSNKMEFRAKIRGFAVSALTAILTIVSVGAKSAVAQHYEVIHNFTGGQDGAGPQGTLAMDRAGKLYGTTSNGGNGAGGVFRLTNNGSGWILASLYNFAGGNDGAVPFSGVTIGPDGSVYGVTYYGGGNGCSGSGCGIVYRLQPPLSFCHALSCPWRETVLYRFQGGHDGQSPASILTFDSLGNIYGTTSYGGSGCCGTVFELMPSNGGWTKTILYSFTGQPDGAVPNAGVIFDQFGALYGTTANGGAHNAGTIFNLLPAGSGWIKNTLYSFYNTDDGELPFAGLVYDIANGSFYGAAAGGGTGAGGTAFELTPALGNWTFTVLYPFPQAGNLTITGPQSALTMDLAGNLYGTTFQDGAHGQGSVFKLTFANGGWTHTSLYDFTGGNDGGISNTSVVFDSRGNLYGTTIFGGTTRNGVVFEITP
jgi:uncharacterized repeat protein (TIGR03803 family)